MTIVAHDDAPSGKGRGPAAGTVDCDVHNCLRSPEVLKRYLAGVACALRPSSDDGRSGGVTPGRGRILEHFSGVTRFPG